MPSETTRKGRFSLLIIKATTFFPNLQFFQLDYDDTYCFLRSPRFDHQNYSEGLVDCDVQTLTYRMDERLNQPVAAQKYYCFLVLWVDIRRFININRDTV